MVHHPDPVALVTGPGHLEDRLGSVSDCIIVVISPHLAIVIAKCETHSLDSLALVDNLVPVLVSRLLGIYSCKHTVSESLGKQILIRVIYLRTILSRPS